MRAQQAPRSTGITIGVVVVSTIIGAIALISVFRAFAALSGANSFIAAFPFLVGLGLAIVVGIFVFIRHRATRVMRYRLSRFAVANGMTYKDRIMNPALPGMIFQLGHSRVASQLVRGTTPRFVEFGNYQYTIKHGKSSTTHHWGYVAVRLDVPLPNIVLDALGNNAIGSNLPASFHKDQTLSLEGDFDRYFTLYCPEGYEQDALYLFTPDIMARFIDHAAELDVEIVDDWLFLYTKRQVSTLDAATWEWLFGTVGALLTKLDQWARWRDDRLIAQHPVPIAGPAPGHGSHALPFAAPAGMLRPPPGVAREGRRLKRRGSWVTIALIVVIGAVWAILRNWG